MALKKYIIFMEEEVAVFVHFLTLFSTFWNNNGQVFIA